MNDLVPLADAHCSPKRGQEHRLSEASVRELMPQVYRPQLKKNVISFLTLGETLAPAARP